MKSLLPAIFFLTFSTLLISQEFAPIGAKWHVQMLEPFASWEGTLTNESVGDTSIHGLACKLIYKSHGTTNNEIFGTYTLCQSNDSVFHYIPELDSLNLAMDLEPRLASLGKPSTDQMNMFLLA